MAPEVGLEPTTLRLTAKELVEFPATTGYYSSLSVMYLGPSSVSRIAIDLDPL
jgi:hypothetical protein